ncbi:hypothetical protein NA56DRAFT_292980 [Hyaloscypha hepaticicola]|uniref:Uncharacterized protein n=1 Tax=Hyaloscypha hepaticicola TaxID=2082293 RepID=A0A2J6QK47_9HELO|nr:hypothetical protein NA56DRAFT_292980 [Hyaloscypha hepaticicola]
MVFSKQSGGYTQQRSVQPLQAMAFQEENEEDPSQSTYSPHPTRYEVPNFVCPLGHQNRMQAREEEPPCRRPPNENPRDSDEYISQITKARIRGKTQLILEGLISIQDMQPVPDETSLEPAASQKTKPRSFVQRSCHILDLTREKQIEQIAHNNAQSDVEAWEDYLDRYTKVWNHLHFSFYATFDANDASF